MEPALKLFTRQAGSVFDVGAFCKPRMSKIQNLQIKKSHLLLDQLR